MEKRKGRSRLGILAALLAFLALGCSRQAPVETEVPEVAGYTKSQMMVIALTERNRYEQVYTDRIWDAIMEDGDTFGGYLSEQVRVFLENMKTMTLLAREREISMSSGEEDRVRRVARNFYSSLSRSEIEYMELSEEDVLTLYEDYHMANKLVEALTEGMDLEVSDSEAKVIVVRQAQVGDRVRAESLYGQLMEEGSDFSAVVRSVTGSSPAERRLWRGAAAQALEEAAFSLSAGQISPVVESDGAYYIFQCVSDYDMDATRERKARLCKERKNRAFQQIYEQFASDNRVSISKEEWSQITFEGGDEVNTSDFFELYQEEFAGQGYQG